MPIAKPSFTSDTWPAELVARGSRNPGVPLMAHTVDRGVRASSVAMCVSCCFASPKSANRTPSCSVSKMFCGFTSRCKTTEPSADGV